jgi:hypothetical protein
MDGSIINMDSNPDLNSIQPKTPRKKHHTTTLNQNGEDTPGCLGLLKKISCTLHCGGSTCSIKETEQLSTSPSVESCESCESLQKQSKVKARPRKRKLSSKSPSVVSENPETIQDIATPKKRVRRSPKKKHVPEAS